LKVHPGRDWLTVLSGTLVLLLGERTILVETGQAVEFSTMIPHAFGARGGPAEILGIFDHDGQRTDLRQLPYLSVGGGKACFPARSTLSARLRRFSSAIGRKRRLHGRCG
jgi:hypothetical protein